MPKLASKSETVSTGDVDEKIAKWLRPYVAHGVKLNSESGAEAIGDCPFCGRENKFYISVETGMWSCKVCQTGSKKGGGNVYTFIRELHKIGDPAGEKLKIEELAKQRKLLSASTLKEWGVKMSPTTGEWLLPAYDADRKMVNLYRYARIKNDKKGWTNTFLPTPELSVGLLGVNLFDKTKTEIHLHESWGNALAMWEIMRQAKYHIEADNTAALHPTSNESLSMYADANVLGMTSAWVFQESWLSLFAGKTVYLWFDSDHSKIEGGKEKNLAGFRAMRRTAEILSRPGGAAAVHYVCWGPDGYDKSKPDGWDVRDHLSEGKDLRGRVNQLADLMSKVQPIPPEWVGNAPGTATGSTEIDPENCQSWDDLIPQWNIAMQMTDRHIYALATMLSVAISTRMPGAQLWMLVLSPPATGKTTLADGLSVSRKYTYSLGKFTGFFSGYDDGTDKDHSPIVNMFDKTVIIKEGATLLSAGNRDDLISDFTEMYDRTSQSVKKNKKTKAYAGNMTVLILGTGSMRQMEAAETGARFLVCSIMNEIPEDLEDDILLRASYGAIRNAALESNCKLETHFDADKLLAMKMTGGYLNYLRDNANELCGVVEVPDQFRQKCCDYAKFVSYMRARPSKVQDESADREMPTRLVEQFIKLAIGYAAVTGKKRVDKEIMNWVRQVCLDSSYGKSYQIAETLIKKGGERGLLPKVLTQLVRIDEKLLAPYRLFLVKIGVVEEVEEKDHAYSATTTTRYRISPKVRKLYESVTQEF